MSGDEALREGLRGAIGQTIREHLAGTTGAGRLGGFLLSFDWIDIGVAAGEHLVVDGRDTQVAVRALSHSVRGRQPRGGPGTRLR